MSSQDKELPGGKIVPLRLSLGREMPQRYLSMTTDFQGWIKTVLARNPASPEQLLSPAQQFRELCRQFVAGDPLTDQHDFKKIRRHPRHVFELRTPELRIFGWVSEKDHFICCFGDTIYGLKSPRNQSPGKASPPDQYGLYSNLVVKVREGQNMICIQSEDLNDHFTNIIR